MSDLNTKLNSTLSSVNNIETALENKTGQNLDSTPLSDYDDVIDTIEILTQNIKTAINNLGNDSSSSYESKIANITSTLQTTCGQILKVLNGSSSLSGTVQNRISTLKNTCDSLISSFNSKLTQMGTSTSTTIQGCINNLSNIETGGLPDEQYTYESELTNLSSYTVYYIDDGGDHSISYMDTAKVPYWSPVFCSSSSSAFIIGSAGGGSIKTYGPNDYWRSTGGQAGYMWTNYNSRITLRRSLTWHEDSTTTRNVYGGWSIFYPGAMAHD